MVLAKRLIHFSMPGITLEIALHAGTLLSVCVFYFSSLRALCKEALKGASGAWRYLAAIVVSMVPCGLAYALFGDKLEEAFGDARFVGLALIFTGLLLLTIRQEKEPEEAEFGTSGSARGVRPRLAEAAAIGVGQAVAMLPGVSRSGTTIWVARLLRIPPEESARFSFLMSVPVIGGATLLEVLHLLDSSAEPASTGAAAATPLWMVGVGAVVSAVVGYASLTLLVRMLRRGKFRWFGVYCLAVGVASTVLFWFFG